MNKRTILLAALSLPLFEGLTAQNLYSKWDRPSAMRPANMGWIFSWPQPPILCVTHSADATSNIIPKTRYWPERLLQP